MKAVLISVILFCAHKCSSDCELNWYNKCKNNADCCSKNCDKYISTWEFGVCKSAIEKNECKPNWFNECTSDGHCCSDFCDKVTGWKFGVCKPKPESSTEPPKCQKDYFNECTNNSHCCSDFCDIVPGWKFGVCKPKKNITNQIDSESDKSKCQKNWFNQCTNNTDCCSNFCDIVSGWQFGICKPQKKRKTPSCGIAISNSAQPVVSNGKRTEYGEFPWHSGIYEKKQDSWHQICGGTLISHKVVISAAHCFAVEDKQHRRVIPNDYSLFKVGLGKYHKPLMAHEDDLAQIVEVKEIQFSPQYYGSMGLYANDIAFLTLKTDVEYTNAVRPICIDVGPDNFEEEQMTEGEVGKVVGWGLTEKQKASEKLIVGELPFVSPEECRTKLASTLLPYLRRDKICAGNKNSGMSVCPGDSGGGLVFEDSSSKAHYLRAIVSLGPKGCQGDYALFTKLSSHKELVEKYLLL